MLGFTHANYLKFAFYFICMVCSAGKTGALPPPSQISYFDIEALDLNEYLKNVLNDGLNCPIGIFHHRKYIKKYEFEYSIKWANDTIDFYQDAVPILLFSGYCFPRKYCYGTPETRFKPPNWNRRSKSKTESKLQQDSNKSVRNKRTTFSQTESCITLIIFALNAKRPRLEHKQFDPDALERDDFNLDTYYLTEEISSSFKFQMVCLNFFVLNHKDFSEKQVGRKFPIFADEFGIEMSHEARHHRILLTTVEPQNLGFKRNLKIQNVYIFHSFRHTYEPILIRLTTAPFTAQATDGSSIQNQNQHQSKFILEIYQGLKQQILYQESHGIIIYHPDLLNEEEDFVNQNHEENDLFLNKKKRWRKDRQNIWEHSAEKVVFRYIVRAIYPNLTTISDQFDFIFMEAFRKISFEPVFSTSAETLFISLLHDRIGFFTCGGIREETSFRVFVQPFQKELWIAMGVMWLIFSLFLFILSLGNLQRSRKWENFLQVIFFPYGTLIENCGDFDESNFNDVCKRGARVAVICWLLVGVVLTNGYRGVVTTDVTAPRPKIYHRNFSQLVAEDFSLLGALDQRKVADFEGKNLTKESKLHEDKLYADFNPFAEMGDDDWWKSAKSIAGAPNSFDLQFYPLAKQVQVFISGIEVAFNFRAIRGNTSHPLYPLCAIMFSFRVPPSFTNYTVEDEVCKCGRTAYVDLTSRIKNFRVPKWRRDTVKTRPFYMGSEQILHFITGWQLHRFEGLNGVPTLLETSLESGLFYFYESAYNSHNFKSSLQFLNGTDVSVVPLNLSTNFMEGVLRIFFILLFATVVCLVGEHLYFLFYSCVFWIGHNE